MAQPEISVVVATFNSAAHIRQCLESIAAQTLQPDEILVCDDASTDGTMDIVAEWASSYEGVVRTIAQDLNLGPATNFNAGLNAARGRYLSLVAGDDYWLPSKLAEEHARIREGDVDWVYSQVTLRRELEDGSVEEVPFPGTRSPLEGDVFTAVFGRGLSPRNFLVRRAAMDELGGYDESIGLYEDWDLKIRLSRRLAVACIRSALVVYRQHARGEHRAALFRHLNEIAKVLRKNRGLLEDGQGGLAREAFLALCPASLAVTADEQAAHRAALDSIELPYVPPRRRGPGHGDGLIFLLSMPRSGSTLLQRILGAHPDIHTVGEPWLMLHPFYALRDRGVQAEYNAAMANRGLRDFLHQLPGGEDNYFDSVRQMAAVMYGRAVRASGKSRFLDKTPRYLNIVPELCQTFPDAKFIVLLRHPLAVLSSVLRGWFKDSTTQLMADAAHYADLTNGPAQLSAAIDLLGERASVVRYEELVDDPQTCVARLCAELGLPFFAPMLEYGAHPTPSGGLGDERRIHLHTRPVTEYRDRWREHLQAPGLSTFARDYAQGLGTELFQRLGYELDAPVQVSAEAPEPVASTVRRGEELFAKGDMESAQRLFEGVLREDPDDFDAHNNLGVIAWHRSDEQQALDHLLRALEIRPVDGTAVGNMSRVLRQMGRFAEMRSLCETYLRIVPDDRQVRALLAELPDQPVGDYVPVAASGYRVSAVVSTYNAARFIRGRMDNLLRQSLYQRGELEIIVIDSASEQDEREILADYVERHAHIRYVRTDMRETVYGAWNRGYRMATAPYVINANTDDRFRADALVSMAAALDGDPKVDCVYGDWLVTQVANDDFDSGERQFLFEYPPFNPPLLLYFQISSHAAMLRRRVFDRIGYFDDGYTVFGDREFMLRFAAAGASACKIDQVVGLYLEHPDSLEHAGDRAAEEFGRIRQAFTRPQHLARLFGLDTVPEKRELAALYAAAGAMGHRFYARDGRWVSDLGFAELLFRQALTLDADNCLALNNLAIVALACGATTEAAALLRRAAAPGHAATQVVENLNAVEQGVRDHERLHWLTPETSQDAPAFSMVASR